MIHKINFQTRKFVIELNRDNLFTSPVEIICKSTLLLGSGNDIKNRHIHNMVEEEWEE